MPEYNRSEVSALQNFENSPQILQIKAVLRDMFLAVFKALGESFAAFIDWIRTVPMPFPSSMMKVFGNEKLNVAVFIIMSVYILSINIKTYNMFRRDKAYAVNGARRIPEKTLLGHMWLGGAIGGGIAMAAYRHKTLHKSFVATAVFLGILQLVLYSVAVGFIGFWAFF